MTEKPNISIIMASYNHAEFIGQAIESLLLQDYTSWELLITDDASIDHTLEVLKDYKKNPRIRIFPFTHNREQHMRNFAVRQAHGKYFAFLNSDDLFYPGKLSKQIDVLEKNSQIGAVFTHVKCIDKNNKRLNDYPLEKVFASENQTYKDWLRHFFYFGNRLCISSAIIRRDCFEKVGEFDPRLIQLGDLDLWIKTCLAQKEIFIIPEMLTGMRILKENLSSLNSESKSRLMLEHQEVFTRFFSHPIIEAMPEIFPELMSKLPQDTFEWRYYLLCQAAIGSRHKPMKLLGFTKMHELFKNDEARLHLKQSNRRLMRSFFLSEGAAGLYEDRPQVQWIIYFISSDESEKAIQPASFWTTTSGNNTICLSFPNPNTSVQLRLTLNGRYIPFKCKRFRLYDQQTGELICDLSYQSFRLSDYPNYYFPEIDFSDFTSRWIDIEIERASIPFGSMRHKITKRLAKLFRKFQKQLKSLPVHSTKHAK